MEQTEYQEEVLRLLNLILEELRGNNQEETEKEIEMDPKYLKIDFLDKWEEFHKRYFPRLTDKYEDRRNHSVIKGAIERHIAIAFKKQEEVQKIPWWFDVWAEFRPYGKPYTFEEWIVAIYNKQFDPKWIRIIGSKYARMIREAIDKEMGEKQIRRGS